MIDGCKILYCTVIETRNPSVPDNPKKKNNNGHGKFSNRLGSCSVLIYRDGDGKWLVRWLYQPVIISSSRLMSCHVMFVLFSDGFDM